jgi:hypothetical protein
MRGVRIRSDAGLPHARVPLAACRLALARVQVPTLTDPSLVIWPMLVPGRWQLFGAVAEVPGSRTGCA